MEVSELQSDTLRIALRMENKLGHKLIERFEDNEVDVADPKQVSVITTYIQNVKSMQQKIDETVMRHVKEDRIIKVLEELKQARQLRLAEPFLDLLNSD